MPEISIVMPMYNEQDCAREVLADHCAALREAGLDYEVIAVDNGSRDRTGEIIDKFSANEDPRVRKVMVEVNQGMGHGILTGLAAAQGDIIGWTYGDGQVPGAFAVRIYKAMLAQETQIGKMVRVRREDGVYRWFISRMYNIMFRWMFSTTSRDINGAPKLFRREVYDQFKLRSKDWFIDAEFMIRAARARSSIAEVEGGFEKRSGGSSNVRLSTLVEFFKNMLGMWFSKR